MSNTKTEAQRLADFANELAVRFSEGWHDGLRIDASDIMDLSKVEYELRRLDAALADELNNRDVLDKMLTQCIAERDQLRAQLAKAVAEEREACAKVCDERALLHYKNVTEDELERCAAAIRARSNT